MYYLKKKLLFFYASLMLHLNLFAQTFVAGQQITINTPDYLLISTNNAPVSMNMSASQPGNPVTSVSNSALYVRISSRCPGSTRRLLTARITSGIVPSGTNLTVVSASCTVTNSGGDLGNVVSTPIVLSTIDQNLITNIGTCWTGTGYNDGYQMTFAWNLINPGSNYSLLASGTYNITVVFTLTAHDGNN